MPITEAVRRKGQAAIVRKNRAKTLRVAAMATGRPGAMAEATPARFLHVTAPISDFHYVEDEGDNLIEQAQRRLMWGQRLTRRTTPFEEELAEFEWAVSTATPLQIDEKARRRWVQQMKLDSDLSKRARRSDFGVPRGPRAKLEQPATLSKRTKLKNRTRAERIADLQAALAKEA